jgi:N-acetylmuramoyl-L-alanine amidase
MTWRSHVAILIGLAAAFLGTAATVSAAVATEGTDGSVYAGAMMFDEISSEGIEAGVEDGTASLEPVGTSDVASFVRDLYVDVLGRDPDPAGYDHWISGLSDRSMDGATVAYGFIFSEEYISRNTTDEDYVKMLYRAILGREADKSGLEAWTRNLGWGETRYGVFAGFVRSEEFVTECSRAGFNAGSYRSNYIYDKNVFATGFAKRMYTECLRRDPEPEGWESWIRAILDGGTGAKLAKGFFMSQEIEEANLSSEEYVTRLYRTILDRDPDESGFDSWVKALNEGSSRLYVLRGFVESDEFTALCERFGVKRGTIKIEDKPKPGMLEPGIHSGTNIFYDQGGPIVVIDPGHQMHGMSAKEQNGPGSSVMKAKVATGTEGVVTGVPEYKLDLEVSMKLRDLLLERGYSVVMIRETNDVLITNMERALVANSYNTAVYIRVHANSDDNSNISGVMTICNTGDNPYIANMYGTNFRLSNIILESVVEATGARNTGIWETDTMTGTNWSKYPTTILEMGFMSNAEEDRRMQDPSYQDKIALGAANGIDRFLGR